ncbi:MAG: NADH-quinone oxidoreductase subunit NuoK [Candidatus Dormibacteraeota bacterium]|nr:NADH-quinone oxidoreductase subunit NuoK [Candidatus Dormibacteraeota bacterium]
MSAGLHLVLTASAVLFGIGALALLVKRSVIVMLIGTQFMLTAGSLAFVAFSRFGLGAGSPGRGQVVALIVSGLGIAELAIGLAMAAIIYREQRTFLVDEYESVAG